ncbi:MAG: hypothetical protein ACYDEF_03665 [Methanosarcina sp.]
MVMKRTSSAGKPHVVVVTVRNGPYKTVAAANADQAKLAKKGTVKTSSVVKVKGGYGFRSQIRYAAATTAAKNALIKKLHEHKVNAGIPGHAFSISGK